MPKPSGLLKRQERPTTSPHDVETRPSTLRFNNGNHTYFDGKRWLPSVTGITGKAEDKSGLLDWTAKTVATAAIDEAAELSRIRRLQSEEAAHEWLWQAANRYRDGRGVSGSDLHDVVDRKLSGQDMPEWLFPDIEAMAEQAIAFLNDYSVQVLFSEVRLANRTLGCCGTTDVIGIVPAYGPRPMIIDWKTAESMYRNPVFSRGKNSMQLAAYHGMEFMFWDDRTEADMIETDQVGLIVMIRPEGYKVEDFDLASAWPQFERSIANYHWWRSAESLGRPARETDARKIRMVLNHPDTTIDDARKLFGKPGWTDEHLAIALRRWPPREGAA